MDESYETYLQFNYNCVSREYILFYTKRFLSLVFIAKLYYFRNAICIFIYVTSMFFFETVLYLLYYSRFSMHFTELLYIFTIINRLLEMTKNNFY